MTFEPSNLTRETSFKIIAIYYYIIRVRSAFSLVESCVLLKYTRTDDVNRWRDLI